MLRLITLLLLISTTALAQYPVILTQREQAKVIDELL
jgi:hypothetical protein